jgi:hypothetical protein
MTTMTKQRPQSNVDNDCNDGDGGDGNSDGDSKGNGNDAAAATNSDDVDDNDGGNSRTASEMVLCPILWGINVHIFMPVRLDEISNSIVDTRLKFVYIYQKIIGLVYTYFF